MTRIKPSEITVPGCYAGRADCADFYRRGYMAEANGEPQMELTGYADALRLACILGGLDAVGRHG